MTAATVTLADIIDWWIEVHCACGRSADVPVRMLAQRHGPSSRLPPFVARLRCQVCGAKPLTVDLVDNPQVGAPGTGYAAQVRRPVA